MDPSEKFIVELECRLEEARLRLERANAAFIEVSDELRLANSEYKSLKIVLEAEREDAQRVKIT